MDTCVCNSGWVCEAHPDQPWPHEGCRAARDRCPNPNCDKDPDSIFANIHAHTSADQHREPGPRNRGGVVPKPIIFCPICGVRLMKVLGAAQYWVCENKHLWLACFCEEGIILSEQKV